MAPQEAADNKIFIGFIALIIRCRIYTALKDKVSTMIKKPNYFTVPAAIRELEKIELCRHLDNSVSDGSRSNKGTEGNPERVWHRRSSGEI